MRFFSAYLALVLLIALPGCKAVQDFIHDDEVIAKVGDKKLFLSQLAGVIPNGISPEDSTNLALQYITTWAKDQVFLDVAEAQLSREELDVTQELDDYRTSLLKYRYEQRYVNERLDTLVTDDQVQAYYEAHKDDFVLDAPIVKGRFLRMFKGSPDYERLRDSLAIKGNSRYLDFSEKWIDANVLAREFGTDWKTMMAAEKKGYIEMEDGSGNMQVAFIIDQVKAGTLAPQDYCRPVITDILLSHRKRALVDRLEQELMEDAQNKNKLVIY